MKAPDLERDIQPLSKFRANAANFIDQVRNSKRPMVITQHGESAAVLLDVGEYQKLIRKLALLQDIDSAEQQLDNGEALPHSSVKDELLQTAQQPA